MCTHSHFPGTGHAIDPIALEGNPHDPVAQEGPSVTVRCCGGGEAVISARTKDNQISIQFPDPVKEEDSDSSLEAFEPPRKKRKIQLEPKPDQRAQWLIGESQQPLG